MKFVVACIGLFSLSVAALALTVRRGEHRAAVSAAAGGGTSPVIVELFTSEGCSSCPPADALLAKLDSEQVVDGAPVIVLEEHVDYWDQLGWRDPYSSAEWTGRQEQYVEALHAEGAYTPQMVVDGAAQFVGSKERQARQTIRAASEKPKVEVKLASREASTGRFLVKISIPQFPPDVESAGAQVLLAVTESGLHTRVTAGENSGSDLHHAAIVRSLQGVGSIKKAAAFEGEHAVQLKDSWKRENVRFVVLVQDRKTLRILGAASTRPS